MPPPAAPRVVVVDDTTGLPVFGTGSNGAVGAVSPGGSAGNPSHVSIDGATIAVPVDVQSMYRTQVVLTAAALAAAGVYTSGATDALNFRRITGRVFADVAGTLHIEQSDDNVTFDSIAPITVVASTAQGFDVPVYARYVRLRYVNGAAAQTAFRLSGYLAAA